MHQLAIVTEWQVEIAKEDIPRIDYATIVRVARLTVALARGAVAVCDTVVRGFHEPATATPERQVLIFAIVNAVISLARINITFRVW